MFHIKLYRSMSAGRLSAATIIVLIVATLILIIVRSMHDQMRIHDRIEKYQSFQIFENIHISGKELGMTYMDSGKDSLAECKVLCAKQQECVAVNYYHFDESKAKRGGDGRAQCWRFSEVVTKNIDPDQPCCVLATFNLRGVAVSQIEQSIKKNKHP